MTTALRELPNRAFALLRFLLSSIGRLGIGRQGALAATRRLVHARAMTPARRTISLFVGSGLIGTGVALLTQARLGLSPFDVLVSGLAPRLGLSFGQTVIVVSGVLFLVAALLGQRPSRWGLLFICSNAIAIDAVSGSINSPDLLVGRILFVGAAVIALAAGISLVVHSGATGGAFELLMTAGEVRGIERRVVRTFLELSALSLGIALDGSFGPATFVIALAIGPLLGAMGQAFADHSTGRTMRLIDQSPERRHPSAAVAQRR